MKPIIGLSPLYDDEKRGLWMRPGYLDVLYACGAIPVVLPFDSSTVDDSEHFGYFIKYIFALIKSMFVF